MFKLFVLEPVIVHYKGVTPDEVQGAISNTASDLSEPFTASTGLLRGYTKNAETATKRFLINSTN
jgi:ABC-type transporter lipoprotein component MlaA